MCRRCLSRRLSDAALRRQPEQLEPGLQGLVVDGACQRLHTQIGHQMQLVRFGQVPLQALNHGLGFEQLQLRAHARSQ